MNPGGVFDIVLSVFALIGIGYAMAASRFLSEDVGDALGDFVFIIAIPVLIFKTLVTADFSGPSPWFLWITYFTAAVIIWVAGDLVVRLLFARDARSGVIGGVSSAFANTVLLGIPIIFAAFGPAGAAPFLLIVSIHLPFMMVLSTVLIERAEIADGVRTGGSSLGRILTGVATSLGRNPIIWAILLAFIYRFSGLPFGGVPAAVAAKLAEAAAPCALFSLGMSLKRYGIRGNLPPALALSVLKLVAFPALVWLIADKVLALPPLWTAVCVVGAACPTGVNAYLIANRFRTGHALAANTITITTAIGVISIGFWLTLMGGTQF